MRVLVTILFTIWVVLGSVAAVAVASDVAIQSAPATKAPTVTPAVPPATPGTAPAQPTAADPPAETAEDPLGAVGRLMAAVRSGNWRLVASLVLALLMLGLTKVRKRVDWFAGDRGGAVLVGVLSLAGALSTALATSAPVDVHLFVGALGVMLTAVGGYSWVKRLLWPADDKAE